MINSFSFFRLGDLNNLFTMPPPQGIPPKQKFMCSCTISDIVKAFSVCNGTDTETCSNAYRCQRNDRASVPLLSFEMDITDIVLSNMLLGFQSRLYVFPWDNNDLLRTDLQDPSRVEPSTHLRNIAAERRCAQKLSNILFAVLCRESLRLDLSQISSFCPEAMKVETIISNHILSASKIIIIIIIAIINFSIIIIIIIIMIAIIITNLYPVSISISHILSEQFLANVALLGYHEANSHISPFVLARSQGCARTAL